MAGTGTIAPMCQSKDMGTPSVVLGKLSPILGKLSPIPGKLSPNLLTATRTQWQLKPS